MKLSTNLIIFFVVVALLTAASTTYFVYSRAESQIKQNVYDHLQSVSGSLDHNVQTFLDGQLNKIELIANQQGLSNEELNAMVKIDDSFYDMFVIDSNGTVIYSSNPERIGLYRGNRSYFVNARNKSYISSVYFALVPGQYSIAVSTPFHEGVLVGSMKLDVLERIVSDRSGMGKTGESILAFRDEKNNTVYFTNRLFSDKKFESVSYNKTAIPMFLALNGENAFTPSSKDYRGVDVISVSQYLDWISVGMVTKMDESEAIGVTRGMLVRNSLIVAAIAVIFVSFLGFYVSRKITKPIKKLSADVDEITKGRLDIQLQKSDVSEIQELTNSMNRILASMKLAILRTNISKSEMGLGEAMNAKEEAEDRYKVLFENASDQIFVIDENYKYVSANKVTLETLEKKPEELIGKTVSEALPKKMAEQFMKNLKGVFKTGKVLLTEEEVNLPSGKVKISTKLSPVKDKDGNTKSILGIVRIISSGEEHKTPRESKK